MLLIGFLIIFLRIESGFGLYSNEEWQSFKVNYHHKYTNLSEETYRKNIFQAKLNKIRLHNRDYELGLQSYKKGINRFTDKTDDELAKSLACCIDESMIARDRSHSSLESLFKLSKDALPNEVDYRKQGAVTAVKDQDLCGSCWAFSAIGALESHHYLMTKKLVSLSAQHLLDCTPNTKGCKGGYMADAYDYVIKNKGIASEELYPYNASVGRCSYKKRMKAAEQLSSVYLPKGNETQMQIALAQHGPLAAAVYANNDFLDYTEGIFYSSNCTAKPNHAVLVVGYGTEHKTGLDYWIVKNSWGENFGENGYIRMSRNMGNNCNISSYLSYPVMGKFKERI